MLGHSALGESALGAGPTLSTNVVGTLAVTEDADKFVAFGFIPTVPPTVPLHNLGRLRLLLPPWFGSMSPVLDGVLSGIAAILAFAFSLFQYVKRQTRISTATDGWLELIAWDFFGARFPRRKNENDD